jgi:hypothetical protein
MIDHGLDFLTIIAQLAPPLIIFLLGELLCKENAAIDLNKVGPEDLAIRHEQVKPWVQHQKVPKTKVVPDLLT